MPVDISLLRSTEEGGNIREVEKWQLLRILGENYESKKDTDESRRIKSEVKSLLNDLCQLDQERRISLKECCESRFRLKQLQNSLAPEKKKKGKNVNDNDKSPAIDGNDAESKSGHQCPSVSIENVHSSIRQEIENLKKAVIPKLNEKIEEKSKALDSILPRIMNLVVIDDNESFYDKFVSEIGRDFDENDATDSSHCTCLDPLYCIDGYEITSLPISKLPLSNNYEESPADIKVNPTFQERAYLCNNGILLYEAICRHAKESIHCNSCDTCNYKTEQNILNVPQSIPFESIDMANALLGCKGPNKRIKNVDHVNIPSSIVPALLQQNKTFTDRQLPKVFVCNCQGSNENSLIGFKKLPLIHTINQVEIFAISTCNLSISIGVQDDIVKSCITFYKSLLTNITNLEGSKCNLKSKHNESSPLLRVRSTSANDLDANEVRRIEIEGYLQSTKEYVCLGHVSNYSDYISRGLKIKCGGRGQEFAHLIHGKVCDHNVLNWLLENNNATLRISDTSSRKKKLDNMTFQEGIVIPFPLVRHINSNDKWNKMLFMPFQRQIKRGKGGKITVKEMKDTSSQTWFDLEYSIKSCKSNFDKKNRVEKQQKEFELSLPSAKDEASCNPYSFLPFFID